MPSPTTANALSRLSIVVLAAVLVTSAVTGPAAAGPPDSTALDPHASTTSCALPATESTPDSARATPAPTTSEPRVVPRTADGTVPLGRVAVFHLTVPPGSTANVSLGSGIGYPVVLRVTDDGDGRVTLLVNTYVGAHESAAAPDAYRVRGDDSVSVLTATDERFHEGSYPLRATVDGETVAERQLWITDPELDSVTALRGVPRAFDAQNASTLRRLERTGHVQPVTENSSAIEGETLVLRFDTPSLFGALATRNGTTTERVAALHDDREPEFAEELSVSGPCGGLLVGRGFADGSARAVTDARNGTIYVLVDTVRVDGIRSGGQTALLRIDEASPLTTSGRYLEAEFGVDDRRVTVDQETDGAVSLPATDDATLSGETNLLPGSRLAVTVQSRTDPEFQRQTTATVDPDGTYTATLPLANASSPDVYELTVAGFAYRATRGDPPQVGWLLEEPSVYEGEAESDIEALSFPDDGLLVAYHYDDGRFRPVGAATRTSDKLHFPAPETSQHVMIVAHRDVDDDDVLDPGEDPPFRVGGEPVQEWLAVPVDGEPVPESPPEVTFSPPTPTPTPSPTPTDVHTTVTPTRTPTSTPYPTTTGPPRADGPTLGLLAVPIAVVVALVLVGLVARRRR